MPPSQRAGALAGLAIFSFAIAYGQPPKVVEKNGHLSPLQVRITFKNDTVRDVLLLGIGGSTEYSTHQFGVRTEAGTTQRYLWLDNLSSINGTSTIRRLTDEFTVVLKDRKELAVGFSYYSCDREIPSGDFRDDWVCRHIHVKGDDDSNQLIDLRNVKSLSFVGPARKDKAGNAMFDHWRFSPYTGESLIAPTR